jgi:hypothetical protein
MKGEHKPGYKAPRTGEPRATRQPFALDNADPKVRAAILKARARGRTWEETAEAATKAAGAKIAVSSCHRWYDVRVQQVQKEVLAQAEQARALAGAFASKGFKDLPEAALNALSSEVFSVMNAKGGAAREKSLGNLVFVLSRLIEARARKKAVELDAKKVALAEKRFEQLKEKTEKATNDAAAKLASGKPFTLTDINNIRERVLGLPPLG